MSDSFYSFAREFFGLSAGSSASIAESAIRGSQIMQSTGRLRVKGTKLQTALRSLATGKTHWVDVPVVKEDAPDIED